ncbi:hypothetical protein MNBD_ALPHA06-170 [hydrothermal vent metagenome]|uniref:Uncharacterized protein n=1 Tax=hydrothermal vent metagenome TaxID=652676 RepID=A0A3B0RT26_9ZZZZ
MLMGFNFFGDTDLHNVYSENEFFDCLKSKFNRKLMEGACNFPYFHRLFARTERYLANLQEKPP